MRRFLFLVLLLLLAAYLLTGVRQVRPGERAVVRRLGRVLDEKPSAGLWVGLPWGMDRVDCVPVSLVRRVEIGYQPQADEGGPTAPAGQLLTGDHNLVNARVVVEYAVAPGDDAVVDFVLQQDRVDGLVARTAETVMTEWAAGRRIDDLLIQGKAELPALLVRQTQERLEPYRLGVQVLRAGVDHLLPPEEVKSAFDDVTRAHADIRTREEGALRKAGQLLADAQRERTFKEQQAAAYADEQRRLARAEAAAFERRRAEHERLRRENANVLDAIWWDEMARLFAGMQEGGRIDLLDHHLGADGLDITVAPPLPRKK